MRQIAICVSTSEKLLQSYPVISKMDTEIFLFKGEKILTKRIGIAQMLRQNSHIVLFFKVLENSRIISALTEIVQNIQRPA